MAFTSPRPDGLATLCRRAGASGGNRHRRRYVSARAGASEASLPADLVPVKATMDGLDLIREPIPSRSAVAPVQRYAGTSPLLSNAAAIVLARRRRTASRAVCASAAV